MKRVVLLLALILSPLSQINAQGVLPASTGCIGDSITTLFRDDVQRDSLAMAELDAHEIVHRQQIKAAMDSLHIGCAEALWTLTATPLLNLMAEVPAYRAQAEWLRTHTLGFDQDRFYEFVARALYASYIPVGCEPNPVEVNVRCKDGRTRPALPYQFILGYLVLGRNPGWPSMPEFPVPSLAAGDSLLQNLKPSR